VNVLDLADVRRAHDKLLSRTSAAIVLELANAGKYAVDFVRQRPTFTPRSGELQAKTQWIPYKGRAIRIQNAAKHVHAIDGGAGPHVIRPKRPGGMLRFRARDGRWVSTRKVNHPGNRPYRFLGAAVNAAGARMFHGLEERMHRAAVQFSSSR
jgi:hypothetical protein